MDKILKTMQKRLLSKPQEITAFSDLKPDLYPKTPNNKPPIPAAVLIALVRYNEEFKILYTKRSSQLRSHSGQIAFPGGKIDKSDKDAAFAAMREANEEVAMRPSEINILGYLPSMFTGTNYIITPVVAVVKPSSPFIANPDEVDEVFEVPLSFLLRDDIYQSITVWHGNKHQPTYKIDYKGRVIWGITANLTRALKEIALVGISQTGLLHE